MTAIEKDLAVISSVCASDQERLEALKYLGHWVGDVHQVLAAKGWVFTASRIVR